MYNGENIMLIDAAWRQHEACQRTELPPVRCNFCGQLINRGSLCQACALYEMEAAADRLETYLKDLHKRAQEHINGDHSIMAGLYEGGVTWALNTYVAQMKRISQEAGAGL